jgi:hypothetical protein
VDLGFQRDEITPLWCGNQKPSGSPAEVENKLLASGLLGMNTGNALYQQNCK